MARWQRVSTAANQMSPMPYALANDTWMRVCSSWEKMPLPTQPAKSMKRVSELCSPVQCAPFYRGFSGIVGRRQLHGNVMIETASGRRLHKPGHTATRLDSGPSWTIKFLTSTASRAHRTISSFRCRRNWSPPFPRPYCVPCYPNLSLTSSSSVRRRLGESATCVLFKAEAAKSFHRSQPS